MYQNIPPLHCRRKWSFAGRHDSRHSLTESLSLYGRPSNRQRDARRRHVQEQEGQGAAHLEMQGEAQEGRNYGYGRLAGAKSERKKGRAELSRVISHPYFRLDWHGSERFKQTRRRGGTEQEKGQTR